MDLRVFSSVTDRAENCRLASVCPPDDKDPEAANLISLECFQNRPSCLSAYLDTKREVIVEENMEHRVKAVVTVRAREEVEEADVNRIPIYFRRPLPSGRGGDHVRPMVRCFGLISFFRTPVQYWGISPQSQSRVTLTVFESLARVHKSKSLEFLEMANKTRNEICRNQPATARTGTFKNDGK
jgi:hypothetical protein